MALDQRTLDVAQLVGTIRGLLQAKFGPGSPVEVEFDAQRDQIVIARASQLFEPAEQQAVARGGAGSRRCSLSKEQLRAATLLHADRLEKQIGGSREVQLAARQRGIPVRRYLEDLARGEVERGEVRVEVK